MTRRERLEAKLDKRLEWAEGRDAKASRHFNTARTIADGIPFGQPILVGHHSEKHARRDAGRIDSNMRNACDSSDMAAHHRGKAAGIESQLNGSIFSDDPDALEALEARIAELNAKRDKMKASNKAFRKGDEPWAALLEITVEQAAAMRVKIMEGYSWCQQPHPSYELQNLGGNINRLRKRLKTVAAHQERSAAAEAAGGVSVEIIDKYARVTFAEKPDRSILNDLRAAGFRWGSGCWTGYTDKIPESINAS